MVAPDPNLLAVSVRKRRAHYRVDACMVESTDIDTDAGTIRTIAIESPDRALVSATVVRLGLGGRGNVNMARGLKRLVGFGGRPNAVIDVGTNSVKFYVAEQRADGTTRTIADRADVTRLGEGLDESGALSAEAIRRTVDAVCALHDEALSQGADTIVVVGTAGLRSASNRGAFDEALRARCGLTIEIISGDDEGRLAYLAATAAIPLGRGRRVVFDSGGGSTQFTFGHGDQVDDRFSLDVGAVRVTDRYGLVDAVSEERLNDVLDAMAGDLGRLDGASTPEAIIAMGGTVTNLAAVKHGLAEYDADVVEGTTLDLDEIDRQIECYRTRSATERRDIVGLQPNRANVILGGACLLRAIVTKLGSTSFTVSTRWTAARCVLGAIRADALNHAHSANHALGDCDRGRGSPIGGRGRNRRTVLRRSR